eukprot:Gb_32540 [translate_table: standard]
MEPKEFNAATNRLRQAIATNPLPNAPK